MGTSTSYGGIKGNPNWSQLSSSVTRACDTGNISSYSLNSITSNFVKLIGGANYGGRGRSKIGGKSGIRTAKKLGGFLSSVKDKGFQTAMSEIGFNTSDDAKPSDAINHLLEYCAGVASSLDDTAAKTAEKQLLEEIESESKDFAELAENFESTMEKYSIEELLTKYYAYYVYEHLSCDFYEKLIEEKGKVATSNFYTQLKRFLVEKIKNVARKRDLSKVDWTGEKGDELVKNIFEDTLNAFENYES